MPKIVDHDEYRKEMMGKCFHLFSRKGYSNTTMREIASEIGVSTGTLYHYFPTKEKILEQMFTYFREINVGEALNRIINISPINEKFDIIADFWKDSEGYYQSILLLAIDLFRNSNPDDREKIFSEFSEYYINVMTENLDISKQFAKSILIYLLGLVFHSLLTPGYISYSEQISLLKDVIQKVIENDEKKSGEDSLREELSSVLHKR